MGEFCKCQCIAFATGVSFYVRIPYNLKQFNKTYQYMYCTSIKALSASSHNNYNLDSVSSKTIGQSQNPVESSDWSTCEGVFLFVVFNGIVRLKQAQRSTLGQQ